MKKILLLFTIVLSSYPLYSQSAEIQVSRRTTYIGQPVQIILSVTDGKAEVPDMPQSDNYTLEYRGISTAVQSSIINGKSSQTIQRRYTWILIPKKTGTLSFPSLAVNVEGKTIETKPFLITVKEAREVEGTFVEFEFPEHKIYPGQEIDFNVVWYFSMAVSSPHYSFPFLSREEFNLNQPPPPSRQDAELYTFNIGGNQIYAERSAAYINGEQYSTLTFPWILSINNPGNYTLEPLAISMEVSTGQRDSWLNPVYEPAAIQSKEATLHVTPLPKEIKNSPTGVLLSNGKLEVKTSLDPVRAYVGDPLTLTVEFSNGIGLRNYDMPPLIKWKDVVKNFKVPSERSNGRYNDGILTFSQTIRPKTNESTIFPSLDFLYLDVTSGKVGKIKTEPINLQLETTSVVTSQDIEQLGEGGLKIQKTGLEEYAEGIAAFIPWESITKSGIFRVQANRFLLYIILLIIPLVPVLFILLRSIFLGISEKRGKSYTHYKNRILGYTRGEITLSELEKILTILESDMPPNPHLQAVKEKLQEIRFSGLSKENTSGLNNLLESLFRFWEVKANA